MPLPYALCPVSGKQKYYKTSVAYKHTMWIWLKVENFEYFYVWFRCIVYNRIFYRKWIRSSATNEHSFITSVILNSERCIFTMFALNRDKKLSAPFNMARLLYWDRHIIALTKWIHNLHSSTIFKISAVNNNFYYMCFSFTQHLKKNLLKYTLQINKSNNKISVNCG